MENRLGISNTNEQIDIYIINTQLICDMPIV